MAACLSVPMSAGAQESPAHRLDSLTRRLDVIQARLDSLERLLENRRAVGDTAALQDELARLRAAARAVAPEQEPDTAEAFVIRSRSLNQLNPEISVTADVRFQATRPGPQRDFVDLRHFAVSFQSALDPFSNTKIFLGIGEGHVHLGEAYAYWTGLPGGLRIDVGRFRQQAGELNRWHLHALPESEFPLVIREYFGPAGLVGNGLGLYWIAPFASPGGGVHELWGQATLADNDVLFAGGDRIAMLGHLNNFWQLSRSVFAQVGATGMYGENPDSALGTTVWGADARVTWRPPEQALYRSFTLRAEGFALRRSIAGVPGTRVGGYVGADLQLSRRLHLGGRFDYVEPLTPVAGRVWALVPRLTWWQSEWVFLRAEWQHQSNPVAAGERQDTDRFLLQVVWSIGPHKHESY
jgi:hypothetical protein